MNITVVILNYKGVLNTIDCVNSVSASSLEKGISLKIIVVENGSNDGSKEKLRELKGIKLIESKVNLGYSGGNNLGVNDALKTNADFILILNNDIFIDKNAISYLIKAASKADIISPKIYFAKGFEFHKFRYKKDELGKIIWYAGGQIDWKNIIGKHVGVDEVDNGQYNHRKEIDFATGAAILVKRETFKKIGLFDEKYFLYLEDMDFCVRAKRAGFKIIYEPKATLWHKNAASAGGSGSKLQDYYITRNRLLFAYKFAKLKTKLAVLKQVFLDSSNSIKRHALIDFVTYQLGKSKIKFD